MTGGRSASVFQRYRRRILWWLLALAGAVAAGTQLLAHLLQPWLGPVLADGLGFGLYCYWLLEFGILTGNRGLRAAAAAKLRSFGRRVDDGGDRFVGLAWPCHLGTLSRRLVETDDDVGFLRVGPDGLVFWGDGSEFAIPADNIESVRLVRNIWAPFARVEVTTRDGEPMERFILSSRNCAGHSACRRDGARLAEEIRRIIAPPLEQVRLEAALHQTSAESVGA